MVNASKLRKGSLVYHPEFGLRLVKAVREIQYYKTEKPYLAVLFVDYTPMRCDDSKWQDALIVQTISDLKE